MKTLCFSLRSRVALIATLLFISVIGSGCHRVPRESEESAAREAAVRTTAWLDRKFGFVGDQPVLAMTNRVMNRLGEAVYGAALESALSKSEAEPFRNYPWQAFVINSEKANAFSAGAGTIFVTRGMVTQLNSEAELAAVISHEMAHELLGHTLAALERSASKESPHFVFTLEDELAADTLGLQLLTIARYSPQAALAAMNDAARSHRNSGTEQGQGLSERMANLQSTLMKMPPAVPATENSREFNHARNLLLATAQKEKKVE